MVVFARYYAHVFSADTPVIWVLPLHWWGSKKQLGWAFLKTIVHSHITPKYSTWAIICKMECRECLHKVCCYIGIYIYIYIWLCLYVLLYIKLYWFTWAYHRKWVDFKCGITYLYNRCLCTTDIFIYFSSFILHN